MRRIAALLLIAVLGCAREPAPPPSQPPATTGFLSPRAGDVWTEGSVQVVRWNAPWRASLNVAAVMGGKDKGHLAMDLDPGVDSLVWRVPAGFVTGFGIGRADNVRLRLENAENLEQFVDSDTFTVTGAEP
jgi:hypothetical protein